MLGDEERRELIGRARSAGARALGLRAPAPREPTGRLAEPGAAFVTWKKDGRPRGCAGSVEAERSLAADVEANAVHALLHDPRIAPAQPREFARHEVEVSVIGPFEPLSAPSDVVVGRHGVYVEKGARCGLLLPQVASDWGWDAERLLDQVCLKAGLPAGAWREPGPSLKLFRFEAEVFGEADERPSPA